MLPSLEVLLRTYEIADDIRERLQDLETQFEWGVLDYDLTEEQLAAKNERQWLVQRILDGEEV